MKKKSVSIVVTVKNSKDTIEMCVNSLLKQNYPEFKIFFVDAFSTDGTFEKLKKFERKKKLKLFQKKGGPPTAYNFILNHIKSDFVAFTDADCKANKNWLKELVKGFTNKSILATAGFCATQKNANFLQRIIGKELEWRFKHLPKFVKRAPTMNLMVKTSVAKNLKFDENLFVAYDTDFGYRLTEKGKIKYVPKAIIYHHHRSNLKNYFNQQKTYGRYILTLYLKHNGKGIKGDGISTRGMLWQLMFFGFVLVGLSISYLVRWPLKVSLSILGTLYLVNAIHITKNIKEVVGLIFLFLIRNLAWSFGLFQGSLNLIFNKVA